MLDTGSVNPSNVMDIREVASKAYQYILESVDHIMEKYDDYDSREYFVNELSIMILVRMGMIVKSNKE